MLISVHARSICLYKCDERELWIDSKRASKQETYRERKKERNKERQIDRINAMTFTNCHSVNIHSLYCVLSLILGHGRSFPSFAFLAEFYPSKSV